MLIGSTSSHIDDSFEHGIGTWATFTEYGPATAWQRARTEGSRLVANPHKSGQVLRVGRSTADRPAEGATRNFPSGHAGKITANVMLTERQGAAVMSLTDHFRAPTSDSGEKTAVFSILLSAEEGTGPRVRLTPGVWHSISVAWDNERGAVVSVDGQMRMEVPLSRKSETGLSYVRFRGGTGTEKATDILVERVVVAVTP